ncbi:YcxB family protein [Flavobacterium pectinovorum]|uniref:YcxB family protein n=1 Tax=Flavobacterium pectinovorum TaxID=29533 RepID=A0A502EFW4_9FLAO|nr:YcxB family protein [Flavobacterium pectinovorum]TPG35376.1 YcxB family protein [Flavobacterium pectinovorum]
MEKEILVKNNFSAKTYTKAILSVMFPKPIIWFCIIAFSLLLINGVRIIINETSKDNFSFDNLFRSEILILFFPLVLFLILRRNIAIKFNEDPKNKENIYHIFNYDFFQVKGDSFDTKYFWKDLLKIKEVKDYFIVFIKKNHFLILNKADLKNNQYNELKQLFNSIDIKKSLKS